MIEKILFGGAGWQNAKAALDASSLRQRVQASNLANVATPGYQAKEVVFEELLASERAKLPLDRTRAEHLSGKAPDAPRPLVRTRGGEAGASGLNDVSIERESTELAENSLHFQALSQFLVNRYRSLRDVIRPGA